ncbi:unnamed protein product [Ectocarpus sp. 12 AP-2014]
MYVFVEPLLETNMLVKSVLQSKAFRRFIVVFGWWLNRRFISEYQQACGGQEPNAIPAECASLLATIEDHVNLLRPKISSRTLLVIAVAVFVVGDGNGLGAFQ